MTTAQEEAPRMAGSSRAGGVWMLSAGHAVDDLYQGAVPALIPFFVAARHWNYSTASGIMVAATVLSAVIQPAFGLLTDRRQLVWLVPAGMALAGVGVGLSGLGNSYALTWVAVALSGVGVAAFHPESARLARNAARGSHVAMSWFSLGGNVGFALGPLLVAAVLGPLGITGTLPLAVPAVAYAIIIGVALYRAPAGASPATPSAASRATAALADDWRGFGVLSVSVLARSMVTMGLGTFLALFAEQRLHAGTGVGEAALVTLYGAGAVGTLLGGRLATRYNRVAAVRLSYLAGIACLAGVWLIPGPAVFAAIAATAVAFYVPFSLNVTLGQDYLPGRVGTASGVTLGLAVSIGGLAAPVLGVIADHSGLRTAIAWLPLMPVIAAAAAFALREPATPASGIAKPARQQAATGAEKDVDGVGAAPESTTVGHD